MKILRIVIHIILALLIIGWRSMLDTLLRTEHPRGLGAWCMDLRRSWRI
jgi:hypothetical protein